MQGSGEAKFFLFEFFILPVELLDLLGELFYLLQVLVVVPGGVIGELLHPHQLVVAESTLHRRSGVVIAIRANWMEESTG